MSAKRTWCNTNWRYAPLMATRSLVVSGMEGTGLLLPEVGLTFEEMKSYCKRIMVEGKKKPLISAKSSRLRMEVRGIYVFGDYFFVDVAMTNGSYIPYEIDKVHFRLADKSTLKSTNRQDIDLTPEFQMNLQHHVNERYRNVFVFKKFTFPSAKVLHIELTEKQLSGRSSRYPSTTKRSRRRSRYEFSGSVVQWSRGKEEKGVMRYE
ncbi:MAG: DUF4138 domain-containing protein [Cyclobacteriaceae bacterium]|nr:DUF4138 domain-containing protein [Cyclobacteriaceae bacterium]